MAGGRIDIEVDIDAASVPGRLEKSLGSSAGFASKWAKRTGLAVGAAVGLAAGKALTDSFRGAIDTQNAEASLKGLYGSAEDAADMMARVGEVSRTSPIDTSTYQKAATSLAYLGLKGEASEDILRNVGLAITAAGGNSENMDRATLALTNMVNEGKVTRETLNQLSQAGVPIFTGLAAAIGVSNDELTELISKGGVDLQDVLGVLQDGTGELFQQMIEGGKEAERTFGNSFKAAKNAVTDAIGGAMIPALDSLTPVLQKIGDEGPALIGKVGDRLGELGEEAQEAFAQFRQSDAVQQSIQRIGGVFTQLRDTAHDAGPALRSIVESLAEAAAATGVSTWQVFLSLLETGAQILDVTLVPALDTLASLMRDNQTLVNGLAVGFLALRTVPRMFDLVTRAISPARTALMGFSDEMRLQKSLAHMSGTELSRFGAVTATVQARAVGAFRGITGAVKNLYHALGGLSGISIMGVTSLLAMNASSASSAKAAQDALAQSVADGARAQKDMFDALAATNGELNDQAVAAGARAVKGQLAEIVELGQRGHTSAENLGRAIDNVTGNVLGSNDAWEEQYDHVSAMEGQYKELQSVMKTMKIDLEDVYEITAKGGPEFDELISKLEATGGNGKKVAQELRGARVQIQGIQDAAKDLGPTAAAIADGFKTIADEASSADEKSSALKKTLDALAGDSITLFEAESQVADAHQNIAEAADEAKDATKGYGDELLTADGRLKGSTENGKAFGDAILVARNSLADFVTAGGDLNEKLPGIMDGLYDWGRQLGLTKEQVDGVAAAMGLVPSTLSIAAQVQGKGQVMADLGDVATQLDALDPGAPRTIQMQAITEEAKTELRDFGFTVEQVPGSKLVEVTANTPAAEARLRTLIGIVGAIPTDKRIDTSAPGAQSVIDAFEVLGIKVHEDNEKRIVVDSNSPEVMDALDALNIKTTHLEDGTVVITDNVEDVKTEVNSLNTLRTSSTHTVNIQERLMAPLTLGAWDIPEHATGGRIRGFGSGTSDDVLMWGSAGEHMWTKREVDAVGGHDKVEQLRAAALSGDLPAFAAGGAIDRAFALLRGESGKQYQYGGVGNPSWDCSGYSSAGYASLKGLDPYQRWYTTESDFYALGFRRGLDPTGRGMDIGVYNGGGGMYSHMSSALQGVPFESGGNGVVFGAGATPPSDGQFPNKYHLPTSAFVPPPSDSDTAGPGTSSAAESSTEPKTPAPPAPELTGRMSDDEIAARSLQLAVDDARRRRDEAYADVSSTPEDLVRADLDLQRALNALDKAGQDDTTTQAPSLAGRTAASVPELFGNAASAAVEGQMASLFKELGVPGGGRGGLVGALIANSDALGEAAQKIAPAFSREEIAKQGPVTPGTPGWLEEMMKTIDLPMVLRDSGGPLPHGVAALNLSGDTEWVQTADQKAAQDAELAALRAGSGVSSRELGEMVTQLRQLVDNPPRSINISATSTDPMGVVREIEHKHQLAMVGGGQGFLS